MSGILYALKKALLRDLDKTLCLVGYFADSKGSGIITVIAVNLGSKVNADYVAAMQYTVLARNTMNDLIINRNACGRKSKNRRSYRNAKSQPLR